MANKSLTVEKTANNGLVPGKEEDNCSILNIIADNVRRVPWYAVEAEEYWRMLEAIPDCIGSDETDEAGHKRHTARFDGNAAIGSIKTVNDDGKDCYLIQRVTLPNGRFHYTRGDISSYMRVKLNKG